VGIFLTRSPKKSSELTFDSLFHQSPPGNLNRGAHLNTNILRNFWNDEQGQDLIEYTLLLAFVALASAALFIGAGGSISGIWSTSNSQLVAANTSAS
jgi:Flp pilus assembly pilin Flp